jgi:outer membrane biosynthesis protein TonB
MKLPILLLLSFAIVVETSSEESDSDFVEVDNQESKDSEELFPASIFQPSMTPPQEESKKPESPVSPPAEENEFDGMSKVENYSNK